MVIDMPASFPSSVKTWANKQDNIDDVFAGDINGTYHEIIAIENELMQVGYKPSARVATTQNGDLATAFANGQTVDGIVLSTGDRILIKDQTSGAENGIYIVNASGAPSRAIDANTAAHMVPGLMVYVREGAVNGKGTWKLTTTGTITLGTTPLTFENELASHKADLATIGLDNFHNTGGNARGANAVDLQATRAAVDQVAGAPNSFIAGGRNNKIQSITARGSDAKSGHVEGYGNRVHEWYGHAEGSTCIADGKISHAEGNTCICSSNDAHAEGNMTVTGRRYYKDVTYGSEDAGDSLGVLQYVLIPDAEGDVTSYFPNALTDNITTRYGSGAQKDTKGNIYASGHTPAVWDGDTLVTQNYLTWALHSICIVRGPAEIDIEFINIAKATYTAGVGTKVYYFGASPFASIIGIYTSYAPTVVIGGQKLGNSAHSEGLFTQATGFGSHSEGQWSRAWGESSHAEGSETRALGLGAHAEGVGSKATGNMSHAEGSSTIASGLASHAEGDQSEAIGSYSRAYGFKSKAQGSYSVAEGEESQAVGNYSSAKGVYSKSNRHHQQAYAVGKITNIGDNQCSNIEYTHVCAGVGWFPLWIFKDLEDGKAYNIETMVLGRQTAGTAGTIGDTFAYKFQACIIRNGSTITALGTPIRTLIGRSASMSGDGLATGVRVSFGTSYSGSTLNQGHLRYDGLTDTTFVVSTHNIVQEMGL
jgi:hypothetical protein